MSYRKKPVTVEAWHNTGDLSALPQWMADAFLSGSPPYTTPDGAILVHTAEGVVHAEVGDWIIFADGAFSTCKPDIFALTYEPVITLDFRGRVAAERDALVGNIERLGSFFATSVFADLPDAEKSRLRRQLGVMQEHADILTERIAAF